MLTASSLFSLTPCFMCHQGIRGRGASIDSSGAISFLVVELIGSGQGTYQLREGHVGICWGYNIRPKKKKKTVVIDIARQEWQVKGKKREGRGNKEAPKSNTIGKVPCKHFGGVIARLKGL